MPGALTKLPVELHTTILKYLEADSLDGNVKYDAPISTSTLFPSNAASVCTLWRDILAKALTPDSWKTVVFDIAYEPALLGAFWWSMALGKIEVMVYNSSSSSAGASGSDVEVDKAHEKRRVSAIVRALRPHVQRFRRIVFEVTYSSSLPPPNTFFLEEALFAELTLSCRVDDIDIGDKKFTTTVNKSWPAFETYFPKLTKLSLTGFWFLYLALHAPNPGSFRELQQILCPWDLTISHFTFLPHGNYSLEKLIFILSQLHLSSITFRELSLSPLHDALDQSALPTRIFLRVSKFIHFENVSRDFISHLYSLTSLSAGHQLSFERCPIPAITTLQEVQTLKLKGIIDDDDDQGEGQASSLRHILTAWSGVHLIIDTCPSLDDALLAWMGSEIEYPSVNLSDSHRNKLYLAFPARGMVCLTIQDCDNFTAFALQLLVKTHNISQSQGPPIQHLSVFGKVPSPSEEEKRWFRGNSKDMVVDWMVMEGGV